MVKNPNSSVVLVFLKRRGNSVTEIARLKKKKSHLIAKVSYKTWKSKWLHLTGTVNCCKLQTEHMDRTYGWIYHISANTHFATIQELSNTGFQLSSQISQGWLCAIHILIYIDMVTLHRVLSDHQHDGHSFTAITNCSGLVTVLEI